MTERLPLPDDIEHALDALSTTEDYEVGESSKALLDGYFAKHRWIDWLGMFPVAMGLVSLPFRGQPWAELLLLAALLLGILSVLFVQRQRVVWSLDRYSDALNRWRQIAGTLAVRGP